MKEAELRALIEDVRTEKLPRRSFIERLVGLGLTAPMASMLLMHAGVAQSQPAPVYKPTKRGGGGALKTLWWQGPTLLQPHFANGTKDQEGSRVFYEPLAVWDNDGNLVPILAAEIPTSPNGGVLEGGKVVRWRLKKGVTWHDGKPFTADDVVFTWEYARDPAIGVRDDRRLQGPDRHQGRRLHGPGLVQEADAVLGHRLRRRRGDDHPEAPVRPVRRRQVARRADQPQAGRHRPVHVRRFQAGRHRPRRDQQELPHAEPALLRHDRDEGRRRRDLGGARRAADRRVRLRLEPAGRRRGAEAHGGRRQGQGAHRPRRRHRVHPGQHHRPVERGRRRARQRQEQALRVQRPEGARGDGAALRQEEHAGVHLRPHRLRDRATS